MRGLLWRMIDDAITARSGERLDAALRATWRNLVAIESAVLDAEPDLRRGVVELLHRGEALRRLRGAYLTLCGMRPVVRAIDVLSAARLELAIGRARAAIIVLEGDVEALRSATDDATHRGDDVLRRAQAARER